MNEPKFPKIKSPAAEAWESKEEHVLGRDFFQFQYDFAREMAARKEIPFLEAVKLFTTFLRSGSFAFDENGRETVLLPGATEENLADFAYRHELEEVATRKDKQMPYARTGEEGGRFGCFRYDYNRSTLSITLHFFNAEFDNVGPLHAEKLVQRRQEFADMLRHIKHMHPDATHVQGTSWLLSLPAFRKLFPESSDVTTEIDHDRSLWRQGTIWGQFIDGKYQMREKLTKRFLEKARELPLQDLVLALPMPPRKIEARLDELYQTYGIE